MESADGTLPWFCDQLAQLRADAGGPTLRELSRIPGVPSVSQLSDIFNGKIKRLPDRDVVRLVVTACLARGRNRLLRGPREVDHWLARYDDLTLRLEQRPPPRPKATPVVPVGEWNPYALGVHRSITVDGNAAALTPYVPRRHDDQLRRLLRERRAAVMAVLVGESSTGKTRGMLEAVRACVPDWPLVHPPDAGALLSLVDTLRPPAVLWLNETQRYLDGPEGPAAAQALHKLLSMPPGPVIVLGSMWLRQHWERFTRQPPDGLSDPHQQARELLRGLAYRIDVPPTFDDPVAQHTLEISTRRDRRLALAHDTAYAGRVIQVLAGGVELAEQYNHPTDPYGHAVLTAAIDARRLGFRALLPTEFLRQAAPGYLDGHDRSTPAAQSGEWFAQAMAYAQRSIHGIAALTPDRRQDGMGEPDGFQLHDYLDQHGRALRRGEPVPATAWEGLATHAADSGDLVRLVEQATIRAQYRHAHQLYTRAISDGLVPTHLRFYVRGSGFLAYQRYLGRIRGIPPEPKSTYELVKVYASHCDAKLTSSELSGKVLDVSSLVRWLTSEGRQAEIESALRYASMLDIPHAEDHLIEWLEREGRPADAEKARREAFHIGRPHACDKLVDWLTATGRRDEVEEVLRQAVVLGQHEALYRLLNLLHATARDDEVEQVLRDATNAGHAQAPGKLVDLLCATGRLEEAERTLRHAILVGHSSGVSRLVVLLRRADRQSEAEQLWRYGLTAEGETSPAW